VLQFKTFTTNFPLSNILEWHHAFAELRRLKLPYHAPTPLWFHALYSERFLDLSGGKEYEDADF